jgi:molybdopterin synthase catalytic subunit
MVFRFAHTAIDTAAARREVLDPGAGGYVSFEGWVRDHNEGREVIRLEYEAFEALAVKEGGRIVEAALQRFPIKRALCVHRVGALELTGLAVWVGVSAVHRAEAFDACRCIACRSGRKNSTAAAIPDGSTANGAPSRIRTRRSTRTRRMPCPPNKPPCAPIIHDNYC